jgi:uncharacterized membrane protein YdjX (TVP38/TMEM64 family)
MPEPVVPIVPAEVALARRRFRLVKLGAVAVVVLVGVGLVLRGYDVRGAFEQGLALVRSAGPVVFFLGMALLPAAGAPQMVFTLSAGPLFREQLGMPAVVALAMLAMLINMALSYWLASRVLRPLLKSLLNQLGYKIPEVTRGDETGLIVLLRVTPGIPFPVQNYLLGLARVSFARYLLVSFAIQAPLNAAFVVFGDSLLSGKGKMAFYGISAVAVLLVGTHLLRKHYAKKRA